MSLEANDVVVQGQPRFDGTCVGSCPTNSSTQIGFYCFPIRAKEVSNRTDQIAQAIFGISLTDFFETVNKDLQASWPQLLGLCAIALVLAIVITVMLRFLAQVVVWLCVAVMILGSIAGTTYLWVTWHNKKTELGQEKKAAKNESMASEYEMYRMEQTVKIFLISAVVATIVTVLILVILIAMRNRIKLVITLFKEAGKAVGAMPLLLFQPLWTCIWLALVCFLWLLGWVLIESSGDPEKYGDGVVFVQNVLITNMRWYHLFAFLWISQFVLACQDVTIAGAVAEWYFTRNKKELGWPILTSTKRMYRYHLGSVALGSLIIAIVKLIRCILKWFEKRASSSGNQCCVYCLKCCQCCMWCFEKFLKFLSRNAYIEIAIYGYGFCKAAQKAFSLLVSNALRVAAINSVGAFVLFLAKATIVAVTVVIGFEMLKNKEEVTYIWVPLLIVAFFAYFIAHCFISVYEMTIDTLFLCFCEDCERNDGIDKPYYMSRGLMKYVENSRKALDALEAREDEAKNQKDWTKAVDPVGAAPMPAYISNQARSSPIHRGMTPLHPAYPPNSIPPSPGHMLSPPA